MDAPPIRYSGSQPDFDPAIGSRIELWLDGVRLDDEDHRISSYDCEAGTIIRALLNSDGCIYADGDKIAEETLTGKVEARWKD